jgi:adenosylhomocysteinase
MPRMLRALKSGAVVCNIGHFDNEIDTAYMRREWEWEEIKPQVHKVYRNQADRTITCCCSRRAAS